MVALRATLIVARPMPRRVERRAARARGEAGFTLVEALVAIAVIGVVMTAVTPFLVNSLATMSYYRGKQVAVQVAGGALERARAVQGSALLAGRGHDKSIAQWNSAPAEVRLYLDTLKVDWDHDPLLPLDAGDAAPVPTAAVPVRVDGVDYVQHWYVGRCRQQGGAEPTAERQCENPDSPDSDPTRPDVSLFAVVVAVTWQHKNCPAGECLYVTSSLFSNAGDPTFNSNRPPPTVNNPGTQYSYRDTAASLQLTASGGRYPLTWTMTGLPPGLEQSSPGSGLINGIPTTVGSYTVTVTVTDKKTNSDTVQFTWHVGQLPVLSPPGNQTTRAGTAVSLPITVTGGFAPFTWTATGLPAGLTMNTSTGVISGTPTTYETKSVTVTATDRTGKTASTTFSWKILTLALQNPGTQTTPMSTYVDNVTLTATGGTKPYTWRADNLPDGLRIDPATGRIYGTAWWGTRYLTTIYVADSAGDEVSTTFVWNVPPAKNNDLRFTTPDPANPNQSSQAGRAVSLTVAADGGSASGYIWRITGLPPGLTLGSSDRSNATITGTPSTSGTYPVKFVVEDANQKFATLMFTWTVTP